MIEAYIIIFYTADPKESERYENDSAGMQALFARIVELTKRKAKFTIYELGKCAGDFS